MEEKKEKTKKKFKCGPGKDCGGFIWFLGAIGAAVYYIQVADSFGQGVLGIIKAVIWPAMVVYKILGL